jgi:preprotein translocase subunit Sec61beta
LFSREHARFASSSYRGLIRDKAAANSGFFSAESRCTSSTPASASSCEAAGVVSGYESDEGDKSPSAVVVGEALAIVVSVIVAAPVGAIDWDFVTMSESTEG